MSKEGFKGVQKDPQSYLNGLICGLNFLWVWRFLWSVKTGFGSRNSFSDISLSLLSKLSHAGWGADGTQRLCRNHLQALWTLKRHFEDQSDPGMLGSWTDGNSFRDARMPEGYSEEGQIWLHSYFEERQIFRNCNILWKIYWQNSCNLKEVHWQAVFAEWNWWSCKRFMCYTMQIV